MQHSVVDYLWKVKKENNGYAADFIKPSSAF